jgi:hypothetical protein
VTTTGKYAAADVFGISSRHERGEGIRLHESGAGDALLAEMRADLMREGQLMGRKS